MSGDCWCPRREMVQRVTAAIQEAYDNPGYDSMEELALAAIRAMREPTHMMGFQGSRVIALNGPLQDYYKLSEEEKIKINWMDRYSGNFAKCAAPIWRAMIDEALISPQVRLERLFEPGNKRFEHAYKEVYGDDKTAFEKAKSYWRTLETRKAWQP